MRVITKQDKVEFLKANQLEHNETYQCVNQHGAFMIGDLVIAVKTPLRQDMDLRIVNLRDGFIYSDGNEFARFIKLEKGTKLEIEV